MLAILTGTYKVHRCGIVVIGVLLRNTFTAWNHRPGDHLRKWQRAPVPRCTNKSAPDQRGDKVRGLNLPRGSRLPVTFQTRNHHLDFNIIRILTARHALPNIELKISPAQIYPHFPHTFALTQTCNKNPGVSPARSVYCPHVRTTFRYHQE